MKSSILKPGEKVHVIHRRLFDKDVRRHFIGEIEDCEQGVARATGYVFVIDDLSNHLFVKRPDKRTKIFSLTDGTLIVNVVPPAVDLEKVRYELNDRMLLVTDDTWKMDIKEFGWG
ncbi:MAG: hypothetical protein IH623_10870 [Verrucomicrobia bacterium]|nr:hypothetical protein [Verrucomicrobiota bacterium]